jgi:pyrimidine deaminase RibD-like protein
MEAFDQKHMGEAIALADQCLPIADRIPKVGAVIAIGETVIGKGHRGTGEPTDDDHAEKMALDGVVERKQLPTATLYTTLEPCTPDVRSKPLTCSTELIAHAEIKRVFIGILDPNQGVRGKGLCSTSIPRLCSSHSLSTNASDRTWSVKLHFGAYESHTLAIVRANELGVAFF